MKSDLSAAPSSGSMLVMYKVVPFQFDYTNYTRPSHHDESANEPFSVENKDTGVP